LDMVENSTSPCERSSGWFSPHATGSGRVPDPVGPRTCPCFHLPQAAHCHFTGRLLTRIQAHKVKHGAGGKGEHRTSRVDHCRLVLPAARASVRWRSRCARRLPPRSRGCTRATRSDAWGRTKWEEARHHSRWASSCGVCRAVAQVRRASAATPWRTVRFTRSIKAVFNLPERPNPCKAALRAASVPRRITCETRTV